MNKRTTGTSFLFGLSNKQSVVRFITLVLCVCFIALFFLSTAFILAHADHEHDRHGPDGSCATCIHMMTVESLLKKLYAEVTIVVIAVFYSFPNGAVFMLSYFCAHFCNPVQLKVRLNH